MVKKKFLLIFIFAIIQPTFLIAQESNEFYIFGYVKDAINKQPVSGVIVECINEADISQKYTSVTGADGKYIITIVTDPPSDIDENGSPSIFRLDQNYPNPFSAGGGSTFGGKPSTQIQFQIPNISKVQLSIFNILGQKI